MHRTGSVGDIKAHRSAQAEIEECGIGVRGDGAVAGQAQVVVGKVGEQRWRHRIGRSAGVTGRAIAFRRIIEQCPTLELVGGERHLAHPPQIELGTERCEFRILALVGRQRRAELVESIDRIAEYVHAPDAPEFVGVGRGRDLGEHRHDVAVVHLVGIEERPLGLIGERDRASIAEEAAGRPVGGEAEVRAELQIAQRRRIAQAEMPGGCAGLHHVVGRVGERGLMTTDARLPRRRGQGRIVEDQLTELGHRGHARRGRPRIRAAATAATGQQGDQGNDRQFSTIFETPTHGHQVPLIGNANGTQYRYEYRWCQRRTPTQPANRIGPPGHPSAIRPERRAGRGDLGARRRGSPAVRGATSPRSRPRGRPGPGPGDPSRDDDVSPVAFRPPPGTSPSIPTPAAPSTPRWVPRTSPEAAAETRPCGRCCGPCGRTGLRHRRPWPPAARPLRRPRPCTS